MNCAIQTQLRPNLLVVDILGNLNLELGIFGNIGECHIDLVGGGKGSNTPVSLIEGVFNDLHRSEGSEGDDHIIVFRCDHGGKVNGNREVLITQIGWVDSSFETYLHLCVH